MHHASAHHHRDRLHALLQAGDAQAVPTALGQRQIDRTAAEKSGFTRIGTTLETSTASRCQQRGQQCADETGADQGSCRGSSAKYAGFAVRSAPTLR
jgi:hypothetical protein